MIKHITPKLFKLILNIYPPYWGTGISVKSISSDYKNVTVQMKMRWYNRNYVNTHFGGSIYAMTDPFFMLMLLQILGPSYVVWDKFATIDFIKPGRGTLTAKFCLSDEDINNIVQNCKNGKKYLPEFTVFVKDAENDIVAKVKKVLYIKKKSHKA